MKLPAFVLGLALVSTIDAASADPYRDRRGGWTDYERYERREERGEREVKFRTADGCEVKRKWEDDEYEEKVKCKRRRD